MKNLGTPVKIINLRRRFALASLGVIGVIALSLGWLLANMLTERLLQREGEVTVDFVQNLLRTDDSAQFFVDPNNPDVRQRFIKSMSHVENMQEPVRVNAYTPDGTVLWSTDKTLVGRKFADNDELQEAIQGKLVVHSGNATNGLPAKEEHEGLALYGDYYVESYIPIFSGVGGPVVGAMEFYKIPTQLNESIRHGVSLLFLACLVSALVLFATLYWIVARADKVMHGQQTRLAEAQTLATAVELASAVAHNLRNPLSSIRASAEMLQQADVQTQDTVEHSNDITQAVDRADRWISELVRVSQAPNLLPERVPLAPLMADCLQEMQTELVKHRINVVVQTNLPLEVVAHPAMMRQIILSIIANAIDAMTTGGEFTVDWHPSGQMLVLTLSDNGPGISKDIHHRIFRPFFSTKSGGLGIGLALVKRMVEQWHGSIELKPVVPHGTSVEIRLPMPKKD
jgi:two-component system, NtrC family, sensor histidine kinase HydH